MDSELTLPLDVLLHIVELLAASRNDMYSINSLQNLSQTCKFMVPICRKHLFSSLYLVSDSGLFERLRDLLSKNPDITRYVKSLRYLMLCPVRDHELNILDMLIERSSLRSIELSSPRLGVGMNWNSLPESIRSSLVSLIQLPTVTRLEINNFTRFPATALSGCTNLINLRFDNLELTLPDSESNHVISHSKIPTPACLNIRATPGFAALLNSASLQAGGPIDFSRVQIAMFDVTSQGDIDNINKLIKMTRQLHYIQITSEFSKCYPFNILTAKYFVVGVPLELAGLGESLAINAYRTLTSLGLNIINSTVTSLRGLSRELGFIAGKNILEKLQLDVWFKDASSYLTHFELWSTFDSVLTDSCAFPVLRQVSVTFCWYSRDWSEHEKDAFLESLKENRFPRLVESEAVKFDFSVSKF